MAMNYKLQGCQEAERVIKNLKKTFKIMVLISISIKSALPSNSLLKHAYQLVTTLIEVSS